MRVARLVFWVVVALVSTAAIAPTAARPAGLQLAADPGGRFKISVPSDWQVVQTKSGPSSVVGFAPAPRGQFRANVNVVVENLATPVSPVIYAHMATPRMATAFPEFAVLKEGSAKVAGRPAYYRYYTWRPDRNGLVYQVQTYFTLGRRAFVLTGTTLNDDARIRRDLPVIARIFETFVLTAR